MVKRMLLFFAPVVLLLGAVAVADADGRRPGPGGLVVGKPGGGRPIHGGPGWNRPVSGRPGPGRPVGGKPGWGRPGWGKPGVSFYAGPRYWGPRPWWGPWYGFGFGFGPWPAYPYLGYAPYYYPYGGYYPYSPPVIVQQEPQVYIQQAPPAEAAPTAPEPAPGQYWYYCEDARAYYPYVQQCPRGWMTVVPPAPPR